MIAQGLGIGCGCSMQDADTTEQEFNAFEKKSHEQVFGKQVVDAVIQI